MGIVAKEATKSKCYAFIVSSSLPSQKSNFFPVIVDPLCRGAQFIGRQTKTILLQKMWKSFQGSPFLWRLLIFFFFFDSGRTFYLTLFFIAEAEAWCCVLLHEKFSCQQPIPYSKRKSHVIVWWSQEKGRARSKLKSHMYFILPYLFALLSLEISVDAFQLFILYILWHSAEYSKCGLGRVWACPTRQVRTIW